MTTTSTDPPRVVTDRPTAQPGDLVVGTVAGPTRRGGASGWGTKDHLAVVDHRYGPTRERIYVNTLCGRRGRLESSSGRVEDRCASCARVAASHRIEWPA